MTIRLIKWQVSYCLRDGETHLDNVIYIYKQIQSISAHAHLYNTYIVVNRYEGVQRSTKCGYRVSSFSAPVESVAASASAAKYAEHNKLVH